jgi:hypothetical protein
MSVSAVPGLADMTSRAGNFRFDQSRHSVATDLPLEQNRPKADIPRFVARNPSQKRAYADVNQFTFVIARRFFTISNHLA